MRHLVLAATLALSAPIVPAWAQPAPPTQPASPTQAAPRPPILDQMAQQAKDIRPRFSSVDVLAFLDAASRLPDPGTRAIWSRKEPRAVYSQAQYDALDESARAGLTKTDRDATFYYCTGFGTPLIYARPLEIIANASKAPLRGQRILDFGYGMIGQLRMLASMGNDVHGVDVWDALPALYSSPMDTGTIAGLAGGKPGTLTLHHGRWPAEPEVVKAIGGGYDLVISKNVLKRGYIHPERPVDERFLVKLGVDDDTFLRALHDLLKPSGLALIYNISPPQNPEDKPYLPHADPRCPFPREQLEKAGFEVVAFDISDDPAMHALWVDLGLAQSPEKVKEEIFTRYTLLRRSPK